MKGEQEHADCRRYKETDCSAAQAILQDMLPLRWQKPDICDKVQKVPQRPDAPEEQDAGCQEVKRAQTEYLPLFSHLRFEDLQTPY
jgi:hypothetical protein